jgi:hypothetical protein
MVPPDPLPRQFLREQAHLKRQQQALLPRHGALNLELESSRRRASVAHRHAQMLPRCCARQFWQSTVFRIQLFPPIDSGRPTALRWSQMVVNRPVVGVRNPVRSTSTSTYLRAKNAGAGSPASDGDPHPRKLHLKSEPGSAAGGGNHNSE